MKLLTKELRKKLPPLYSCENVKDPVAIAKFFHPMSQWTWYCVYAELGINGLMPSTGLCRVDRLRSVKPAVVHSA